MPENYQLSVEKKIQLDEQVLELVEQYGTENVTNSVKELVSKKQISSGPKPAMPPKISYGEKTAAATPVRPKSNLPPNARNLREFVTYASQLKKDKVRPYILDKLLNFVKNAKPILEEDMSKAEESFVLEITEKDIFESITSPEEDWLQYNYNILRKQIKRKLFNFGYDFLDSDFEVGKLFNPLRHNIVGKERVDSRYKDNRVLKIINEGLIIGKRLHINANVIIGKYEE